MRMFLSLLLIVYMLSGSFVFSAQEKYLVVKAAQMLDVESGEMIQNPVILIKGKTINKVNPDKIPENAKIIDLGDLTLLPGLMDMHVHLSLQLEKNFVFMAVEKSAADFSFQAADYARKTLMAGFTTVRDLGAPYFVNVSLCNAINSGKVPGPDVFPVGNFIGITGGHADGGGRFIPGILERDWKQGIADGPEEVIKSVRYQIKHGAKVIKIMATAGVISHEDVVGNQQMSKEEMRAAVKEAHRHGVKVAAHAHGTEGIIAAVKAGVDSIEHGSILDATAVRLMRKHGTYLVPTRYVADALDMDILPPEMQDKAKQVLPMLDKSLRKAIQGNVKIAFGTDAGAFPHGDNAKEFHVYVQAGMSPIEAIRTATTYAADLLGVDDRGILKANKRADIIGVSGNPLEDVQLLEDVKFVMKEGKVYKN